MNPFKNTNDILIYDNTIEGLLTAIFYSLKKRIIPKNIIQNKLYEQELFDNILEIETNYETASMINNKILDISDYSFYLIYTAFLSNNINKELIILNYYIEMVKYKSKINRMKNNNSFINIFYLCRKVTMEIHHFKGFLRFKKISNILYSTIEPDNNIIEYLASHFSSRLKNEYFIIYDKNHKVVASYNKHECNYFFKDEIDINRLDSLDINDKYENLWKEYFDTIAIKERTNRKCQLNFMPKKYWKNMIEMDGKL